MEVYEDADGSPCDTGFDIASRELSSFAEFHLAVFPFEVNKQTRTGMSDREDPSAMLELWLSSLRRANSREQRTKAVLDSVT